MNDAWLGQAGDPPETGQTSLKYFGWLRENSIALCPVHSAFLRLTLITLMPELPEVETIVQGLRQMLVGRTIVGVSIPGMHLCQENGTAPFQDQLSHRQFRNVGRRGKLLLLELDNDDLLIFHLRMTGRMGLMPTGHAPGKHVHLLLALDNQTTLYFQDQRKFGTCRLFKKSEMQSWPYYSRLGPEPLQIGAKEFSDRMKGKRGRIKALLLDQRFIAGIGNIYADESLFRAGIHPATPANQLSSAQIRRLFVSIQAVLTEAIVAGGSSIRDYRTAAGLVGSFQDVFQVYGRKRQSCLHCNQSLLVTQVAGRTTCFCPGCQRETQGQG